MYENERAIAYWDIPLYADNTHVKANSIDATIVDKENKKVSVTEIMGKECLQILRNLSLSPEQQNSVASCLDALEAYFRPQRNVVYERYLFNTSVQSQDENAHAYVNRLRKLASSCNFGLLTDELIRDRLVIGVRDKDLKGRLLRQQALTLQKAIEMSKSDEVTKQQLKSLTNEEKKSGVEEVNAFKQKGHVRNSKSKKIPAPSPKPKVQSSKFKEGSPKVPPQKKCKFCGNSMHGTRRECPAYGQVCLKCHKRNHFASVCMAKQSSQVNTVEDEDDSDTDLPVLNVKIVSTLSTVLGKGKHVITELTFCVEDNDLVKHKTSMVCQLDTGASCNVYCTLAEQFPYT